MGFDRRADVIERMRLIANTGPNIAYISRQSSEYVRRVMREALELIDKLKPKLQPMEERNMRNKIVFGQYQQGVELKELECGTMFRATEPKGEDTVYMKTGHSGATPLGYILCILLNNGESYSYSYDKLVMPVRRGQSITIIQGG